MKFSILFSLLISVSAWAQNLKGTEKYNELEFTCQLSAEAKNPMETCVSKVTTILSKAYCKQKDVHCYKNEIQGFKCTAYSYLCVNAIAVNSDRLKIETCPTNYDAQLIGDKDITTTRICSKAKKRQEFKTADDLKWIDEPGTDRIDRIYPQRPSEKYKENKNNN